MCAGEERPAMGDRAEVEMPFETKVEMGLLVHASPRASRCWARATSNSFTTDCDPYSSPLIVLHVLHVTHSPSGTPPSLDLLISW